MQGTIDDLEVELGPEGLRVNVLCDIVRELEKEAAGRHENALGPAFNRAMRIGAYVGLPATVTRVSGYVLVHDNPDDEGRSGDIAPFTVSDKPHPRKGSYSLPRPGWLKLPWISRSKSTTRPFVAISVTASQESMQYIRELAEVWRCSRTDAVNRLLRIGLHVQRRVELGSRFIVVTPTDDRTITRDNLFD